MLEWLHLFVGRHGVFTSQVFFLNQEKDITRASEDVRHILVANLHLCAVSKNIPTIDITKRQPSLAYRSNNLICFVNKIALEIFYLLLVSDKPHRLVNAEFHSMRIL